MKKFLLAANLFFSLQAQAEPGQQIYGLVLACNAVGAQALTQLIVPDSYNFSPSVQITAIDTNLVKSEFTGKYDPTKTTKSLGHGVTTLSEFLILESGTLEIISETKESDAPICLRCTSPGDILLGVKAKLQKSNENFEFTCQYEVQ